MDSDDAAAKGLTAKIQHRTIASTFDIQRPSQSRMFSIGILLPTRINGFLRGNVGSSDEKIDLDGSVKISDPWTRFPPSLSITCEFSKQANFKTENSSDAAVEKSTNGPSATGHSRKSSRFHRLLGRSPRLSVKIEPAEFG